jgi:hypothetical protein
MKINVSTIGEWQNFCPFFRRTRRDAIGDGWEELSPDDPDFERMRAFLTDVQSWIFNINQYAADKLASSDEVPVGVVGGQPFTYDLFGSLNLQS